MLIEVLNCCLHICDGSYLYGNGSEEKVFGEVFRIKDGVLSHISSDNGIYQFRK